MRTAKVDPKEWHKSFVIFPVETVDGQVVWLETVLRRQYYVGFCSDGCDNGTGYEWEYKTID